MRGELLSEPQILSNLPEWLIRCRYGSQFWSYIKGISDTYHGRREYLRSEFGKLIYLVERHGVEPTSISVEEVLLEFTPKSVGDAWIRCFKRREVDPEGAITAARSLLESVCKHILDEYRETYRDRDDLQKLYKSAASLLNLGPSQHSEQLFKKILTGCGSVVDGLAALRNAFGDAHGKGKSHVSPGRRHAELAVNLAGTISVFLISTHELRKSGRSEAVRG